MYPLVVGKEATPLAKKTPSVLRKVKHLILTITADNETEFAIHEGIV